MTTRIRSKKREPAQLVLTCFVFAIWLLLPASGICRVTAPYYIDSQQGLPQNSVRAVLVDHQNLVWVGTERGLARFDGHRFVNFSETNDAIPVDVLVSLAEDSHGRIWTNWFKNNPRVLLPDRNQVIEVTPPGDKPTDLVESLNQVFEDDTGKVWFAGRQSIYWMDADGEVDSIETPGQTSTWVQGNASHVFVGTGNGVFFVDTRQAIYRVEKLELKPTRDFLFPGPDIQVRNLVRWKDQVVVCAPWGVYKLEGDPVHGWPVYQTTDRTIAHCRRLGDTLFLTERRASGEFNYGIVALDLASGNTTEIPTGLPSLGYLSNAFFDSLQRKWVVLGGSLFVQDRAEEAFQQVNLRAPIFGIMQTLAESRNREIWIGTDGKGLAVIAPHRNKFSTTVPPNPGKELTSTQVRSMAVVGEDVVWLATDQRGINRWNRKSGEWRQYRVDSPTPFKELVTLDDGSVWVCDQASQSLLNYDPSSDSFRKALPLPANYCKLAREDGRHLLLASGSAIMRFNPGNGQLQRLNDVDLESPVRAMVSDGAGNIWFGMHQWGLMKLAPDGSLKRWTKSNSDLTSDQVFSLQFDPSGALWIGTWHGGLLRLNPDTERFKHFGNSEGLPDETIFGILVKDSEELWLSTYRGLVRFRTCGEDNCRPLIHLFNQLDGLQGNEFDAESYYRSESGEMFFGGAGGFNAFYPGDIKLNIHKPTLTITRASLNGLPLPGSSSTYQVPEPIELPRDFDELKIEFSSLDYNAPENNRYQHRHQSENEWIPLEGAEFTVYGLPEGQQFLQFRGSNNDGLWSENTVRLDLTVRPPWYRHPLTLMFFAFALSLAPYLFLRGRQKRLLAARRQLREQVAERTRQLELASTARERFFANVSHEIAAPLHMILLMLEKQQGPEKDRDAIYRSATGYAAQLLAYLRQLVEGARSLESDSGLYQVDAASMIDTLIDVNRPVAAGRGINLHVESMSRCSCSVRVYRHSPSSIFSNLLCNALIYTPENGEIRISGKVHDGFCQISIENTLHPDHPLDLDEALERGNRGSFDPTAYGGHGLGLSIVTESIESLGGELRHHVADNGFVVCEVDLPLADSSLPPLPELPGIALNLDQVLAIETVDPPASSDNWKTRKCSGRRVLIIEDDTKVSNRLASILCDDFDVDVAGNSLEGIRLAREWLPEVILCDLFLPDEPGFEVVKAVRSNRMTQDTLFIMITASISETDRKTGLQLGVDQFLHKPVSADTIKWAIRNHVSLGKQRQRRHKTEALRKQALRDQADTSSIRFEEFFEAALEELYSNPDTTIEDLQLRLSMSYPTLVKSCREHFGKTPKRLLVEKRIAKARGFLSGTDCKIGLVAEMTGFSSPAQFATTFKKECGTSPTKYQKNRKNSRPAVG